MYKRLDGASGGWLTILRQAVFRFGEMRGPEASASLAYYALFSIFPLTLIFVALLGFVFDGEQAFRQTVVFIVSIFPFSGDLVRNNLAEVMKERGTLGAVGLFAALWSASGYFTTLARNINRAWPAVKLRGLVHGRLVALGMIGALVLLLLLSLISSTFVSLLPILFDRFGGNQDILESALWRAVLRLVPALFTLLMFVALYRWVPNKVVRWKPALTGAVLVTVVWEVAKSGFTLYLRSGFARYEFVYGSLGTLIVLMLWIYFSNLIALFGAHLVASLELSVERDAEQHTPAPHPEPAAPKGLRG